MRADYLRVTAPGPPDGFRGRVPGNLEAYDRGGLPYERTLTRLGYCAVVAGARQGRQVPSVNAVTLEVARRHGMRIMEADAFQLEADTARHGGQAEIASRATEQARELRRSAGYDGPERP